MLNYCNCSFLAILHFIFTLIVLSEQTGMAQSPTDAEDFVIGFQKKEFPQEQLNRSAKKMPLYVEQAETLYLIEMRQLVQYDAHDSTLDSRTVLLESVNDVAFWRPADSELQLLALTDSELCIINPSDLRVTKHRLSIKQVRFGQFASSSSIVPLAGARDGKHLGTFFSTAQRFGDSGIELNNGWLAVSPCSDDRFSFAPSILDARPRERVPQLQKLSDDLSVISQSDLPERFAPYSIGMGKNGGDIQVYGVTYSQDDSARKITSVGEDGTASYLTPDHWDCFAPVPSPCSSHTLGFQRRLIHGRKANQPKSTELCVMVEGQIVILSPSCGNDASDWRWTSEGTAIAALCNAPNSGGEVDQEVVMIFQLPSKTR